jgi:hypothetical protein
VDANDDTAKQALVEQALRVPEYSLGMSDDKVRASDTYMPLSLRTDVGRQWWDEAFRLAGRIRVECDSVAERLGYASAQDDGLAAVEYIANKILGAVRSERAHQIVSIKKEPLAKSKLKLPEDKLKLPENKHDKPEKEIARASDPERAKLIDELKQMLRDRKTRSGAFIDSQLAHEIAKHITVLNEAAAQPETKQSIKQIRESSAAFFAKLYGGARKKPVKQNVIVARGKAKQTKKALPRTKKNVRKGRR